MRTAPFVRLLSVLIVFGFVIGACGGEDGGATTTSAGATTSTGAVTTTSSEVTTSAAEDSGEVGTGSYAVGDDCTTSEILNSVAGLDAEAREAELLALAEQEGPLTFYSSMGENDHTAIAQAFRDHYGLEVVEQNGSPESQHQRFTQEVAAGRTSADIYEQAGPFLLLAEREGLLAEYNSPHREELVESARVSPYWVGDRFLVYAVGWNTDLVSRDELPDDITGLADDQWSGRLGHDQSSWDWFAAIWQWLEDKGWGEEEIDQFFRALLANGIIVDGNPLLTELTALGEVEVGTNHLQHIIARQLRQDPNLPLEWEPPVGPLVIRPNGPSIPCNVTNPASAILFVDWDISKQAQEEVIVGLIHRPPANTTAEGGDIDFDAYEVINVDLAAVVDASDHWANLWTSLIAETR